MEIRRGLKPRRGAVPALLAGVVALGAIAGFSLTRHAVARPSAPQAQAVASAQAAAVSAQLQAHAALLGAVSQALSGVPTRPADLSQLAPLDPAAAIVVATATPEGVPAVQTVLSTNDQTAAAVKHTDLAARPEWRLALQLARDGGGTVAAAAGPTGGWTVIEAQALYGASTGPAQVADRRQALQGYAVLLEPATSLTGLSAQDLGGHLAVRVVQGNAVLNSYGRSGAVGHGGAPSSASITADGTNWVVQVWSSGRWSKLPWVILIGGLVVGVVVGAVTAFAERKNDRLAEAASARANELDLIARTGPLLQQSLDLAELLPLFVVEIGDELGLEGMAIALVSESGALVRVFSLGSGNTPAERDSWDLSNPPAAVAPGGTFAVPLQRAGRMVGALSAQARNGLEPSQIDALRAVCDLLAAALGNARLFQEEQDMVAKLLELDRLKTTFLGSVSHELRTTVTAIEGFAGLLATQSAGMDEERRTDFIARIGRNAHSLGVLVEDLLDFARLERAGLSIGVQPVDLSDQVPKVIEQMSSILGPRQVDIAVTPGVIAAADPAAMERILTNLLSNAAKYTPAETPIVVTLGSEDGMAVLCVSDRGPGIPPAERERIFDLFYRVDNEAARATRGVGIGLALVRQLVELLHGTVSADQTPGGGARFRVTVPLFVTEPAPYEPRLRQHASPT